MLASLYTNIYSSRAIYDLEQAWFAKGNCPFGLMTQAGFALATKIDEILSSHCNSSHHTNILVWCGTGNNGGDGFLVATYLANFGYGVSVFAPNKPKSNNAKLAYEQALQSGITIYPTYQDYICNQNHQIATVHIDALFGIGLTGSLCQEQQNLIHTFNTQTGLKLSLDLPSGLLADTGMPSPVAVRADHTLTVIALKIGLLTGQGKGLAGLVSVLPLIPPHPDIAPLAKITGLPHLPARKTYAHKGDFGFVAVVGGHQTMGGAVILSAMAAMAVGAGRVAVACHRHHHSAILANNPALMTANSAMSLDEWRHFLADKTAVCLGMGLGRDEQAKQIFNIVVRLCQDLNKPLILDADGLYHLAQSKHKLQASWVATPHSAEAGRLLDSDAFEVEQDRIKAINALHAKYGGNWVLKGAGSLSLEDKMMSVCPFGNPAMAVAGMGDVLTGVIAGLFGRASLAQCVALHAKAGDELAKDGEWGVSTIAMMACLTKLINSTCTKPKSPLQ